MSGNSILETLNCSRDTPEGRQPAEYAETRRHFWKPSREEADEEHEKDRFRALCQSSKIDKGLRSMGIGLHGLHCVGLCGMGSDEIGWDRID